FIVVAAHRVAQWLFAIACHAKLLADFLRAIRGADLQQAGGESLARARSDAEPRHRARRQRLVGEDRRLAGVTAAIDEESLRKFRVSSDGLERSAALNVPTQLHVRAGQLALLARRAWHGRK
ncbi:MAG: hypothetical protein ACK55I_04800, partial [bacterium]